MRLVSYGGRSAERAGLLVGEEIVDLADSLAAMDVALPAPTVRAFLSMPDWKSLARRVYERDSGARVPLGETRLGAPVPEPSKVLVAGANTRSHLAESGSLTRAQPPRRPMFLAKASTAVCGPEDDLVKPPETEKLDYEVELGVVIGRPIRRISLDEAPSAIAGYTVTNDVSARDVQLAEYEENPFYRTHFLGKSFDCFCPTGPSLVTPDELPAIESIRLRTWVNGELRQDSTVADLYFPVPELISYLSSIMTLLPGDLICTGSPAGVAFFRKPPSFLQPGDLVECEAEGIGRLRNRVVAEHAAESR